MRAEAERWRKGLVRSWWDRVGNPLFVRLGGKGAAAVRTTCGLPVVAAAMKHGVESENARCVEVLRALERSTELPVVREVLAIAADAVGVNEGFGLVLPPGPERTQVQFEQENAELVVELHKAVGA